MRCRLRLCRRLHRSGGVASTSTRIATRRRCAKTDPESGALTTDQLPDSGSAASWRRRQEGSCDRREANRPSVGPEIATSKLVFFASDPKLAGLLCPKFPDAPTQTMSVVSPRRLDGGRLVPFLELSLLVKCIPKCRRGTSYGGCRRGVAVHRSFRATSRRSPTRRTITSGAVRPTTENVEAISP